MSSIHLEILDKDRLEVFKQFAGLKSQGYLAGGTALALQINHRKSYDFDFFASKPISRIFQKKVIDIFGGARVVRQSGDQLTVTTATGVKLDFLHYWYKRIEPFISTPNMNLASVWDIACDKAMAVGQRAVWRDYVDIYFLLKGGYCDISKINALAKQKFGGAFNDALFLQQLTYFDDLEMEKIEFIGKPIPNDTIKEFLRQKVKGVPLIV
ncbi:nucleotidyl transferase AbiEii/AbiGii toxin family protein [Candidatus Parcubacteria bacterium]|nr:nucleotidyl transferase AbiEii/AbiGii toxin family protein [Patescibacteria group bacterium]MBU4381174.1 nucleotidyl transferase AbiEii/AbiGii toxin family protein [Patescibacteria group bacterium]MCG2689427.1 nucleotidyl transferase AbiEii/AbiGii toxin family protein [Candidatus Parcubacteria bacterium]